MGALWLRSIAVLGIVLSNTVYCQQMISYPQTRQDSVVDDLHGIPVADPYRWLEDSESPEVKQWTEAQNSVTFDYLLQVPQMEAIRGRLQQLGYYHQISFEEVLLSKRRFVWVHPADREKPTFFWQENSKAPLRPLIDPNRWSEGYQLEFATPSPDGAYVAYGVSVGGSERVTLQVLHVESGKVLPDTFYGQNHGWPQKEVAWIPGTESFFYGALPDPLEVPPGEQHYWQALYLHKLGNCATEDRCIFHSQTIRENLHEITVNESGHWAAITTWGKGVCAGTDVHLLDLEDPETRAVPVTSGFTANYTACFAGEQLLLLTDEEAPNKKVLAIDPLQPERSQWKLVIPESRDPLVRIQGISGVLFAEYLHNAASVIRVFSDKGEAVHTVPLRSLGTATVAGFWSKPDIWIEFSSFAHPLSVLRYELPQNRLYELEPTSRQVDPSRYTVEQVWYLSVDGTPISMFLFFDHTVSTSRKRPTLLTGYGGFGVPITPVFTDHYLAFVEAGGLVAIPNIRGGGEYGEEWHRSGRLEKKQNVFDDFISAAEWLIAHKYCTPETIAIRGRSNGGLLVGAAMTQRPELFRAALCEVPLLDMVRYHKFGFSNIWSSEYGNAEDSEQFAYLLDYSPYHAVEAGVAYPAVLIRGAVNDTRTDAFHVRKMIARLQQADPYGHSKFGLILDGSGHLGAPDISAQIEEKTYGLSFLMDQLGMKRPDTRAAKIQPQTVLPIRMQYGSINRNREMH